MSMSCDLCNLSNSLLFEQKYCLWALKQWKMCVKVVLIFIYFYWCIVDILHHIMEKAMAAHSSTLAGKSHGQRSLVGCSPCGRWESDTTGQLPFHFSLSCTGEGNGNPLQCSCLENPRDGGAWWAAVYGVTQSQTRLKWLSSSSTHII